MNNLEIKETEIPGCLIFYRKTFEDNRGEFFKAFTAEDFNLTGKTFKASEVFFSNSKKSVLRGLHFQTPPKSLGKLVSCLNGKILDVVVDLRKGSPTFKKVFHKELSALDGQSLFIPKGCAHGFYSLTDNSLVSYLVEELHSAAHDQGILWSSIDFDWPDKKPILSKRDSQWPAISQFDSPFEFQSKKEMK